MAGHALCRAAALRKEQRPLVILFSAILFCCCLAVAFERKNLSDLRLAYVVSPPVGAGDDLTPRLESATLLTDGIKTQWLDRRLVKTAGGEVTVDGRTAARYAYLVKYELRAIPKGGFLVARGTLEQGGCAIGLIKDGKWYSQVVIDQP